MLHHVLLALNYQRHAVEESVMDGFASMILGRLFEIDPEIMRIVDEVNRCIDANIFTPSTSLLVFAALKNCPVEILQDWTPTHQQVFQYIIRREETAIVDLRRYYVLFKWRANLARLGKLEAKGHLEAQRSSLIFLGV
jgi:hypothetical protein